MKIRTWRYFDFWLLGAVAVLTIFGIAMINSAIAGNEDLAERVPRQMIYAGLGFIVLLITAAIDYRYWKSIGRWLYIFVAALLAFIYLTGGAELGGAARWIDIGLIYIQPSELAKISMILMLADFFAKNRHRLQEISWIARSLLITLGMVIWILLQPNLSTSIVLLVIWFALLWAAGLSLKHLLIMAAIGLLLPIVSFPFLHQYQQLRIINFLFPDPTARHGANYNVTQALITIGNGGWLGQGYGQGSQVQLRFLKVRHTDFIFSAIAEEFGFVGALLIIVLITFVVLRCLRIARLAPDTYGALISYGVATLISFHMIVNIGMNLKLMPSTGLPLPFISSGGSSLLSLLLGVGLVESVALRQKILGFD
ncbi:MAG: FtsW/RodA/SpoVE family cell cycle protein [Chloroflexota bacterium]